MWQIRRAQEQDHDAILALWDAAGLGRTTPEEWHALSTGPTSMIFVAEDTGDSSDKTPAGAVIGVAIATYDGWRAYIYHLAVHSKRRHEGIGRGLVAAAEQYLAQAGARNAYVMVSDTDGLALLSGAGFLPGGEMVLAKPLSPPVRV